MADKSTAAIMEEREELMVSPPGGIPTLRTAHFLKPTVNSQKDTPPFPFFFKTKTAIFNDKKALSRVQFKGRRYPQKDWKKWVDQLEPLYGTVWKKAGVYEAVMGSTYQTLRHNALIIRLAERWCVETNTFVFPWGEATVTLEDMMVLGGYSVWGHSVLAPLNAKDLIETDASLNKARKNVKTGGGLSGNQYAWMNHFLGSGHQLEHEAFLSLWLSRYVFPTSYGCVAQNVFPIAIYLSRGIQIALAPAVLASIYRDLSLLKKWTNCNSEDGNSECDLWAPFQLVQLWAWERFPALSPQPNALKCGEPRSARWHRLKKVNGVDVSKAIDYAGESFEWRPYTKLVNNWVISKFYRETEEWVWVDSNMNKEAISFARCCRDSELVGINCQEQYLPHRVAMQFGFDQDLPGYVSRCSGTLEISWENYNRSIGNVELYMPPRLHESDVTVRYLDWWKEKMLALEDEMNGIPRLNRSENHSRMTRTSLGSIQGYQNIVPPVSLSICNGVKDGGAIEEDKLTDGEILNHKSRKSVREVAGDNQPLYNKHNRDSSSSTTDVGAGRKMESIESVEMRIASEVLKERPKRVMENAERSEVKRMLRSSRNSIEKITSSDKTRILEMDLEAQITRLENIFARAKAAKLNLLI
ncbi:hypothetical protein RJ640_004666 [Escallonia rubra]|uniref:Aminotransferase-like plant mobile domain-containing protein n=1 Tax=Escallonia rubra TaxID=112253 RepID=A0AA88UJX4_9ASTE|nr:hypothetical protein RJ640_004666 [Escallonia rubra]